MGTADMEGLVGRPKIEMCDRCGKRVIVKIKWEDFK
jgi:DNA-directed RNA polymerase subunit RPC12/RpoP